MRIILTILCLLTYFSGQAQDQAEAAAIMLPINQLFAGMNKGDSAMVHRAFTRKVSLATIAKDKNGKDTFAQEESLDGFLKAVGTPRPEPLSEPIWDAKISVDGNLATVWAQYALYVGKRFNHCGVDAFSLIKGEDGQWRIFHLSDTRRKDNCNVPASISDRFK